MQHAVDHVVPATQAPPRLLQELRETLQRLRLGGPFYVLLWTLAGVAASLWQRSPMAFIAISLGFIGLTVVRFRVRALPEDSGEEAVRGRLDYIWLLLLVNAALWGAASAWLLMVAPEESARTVAAISSYAFATAFAHNFPMRLRHAFAAVLFLYLPTLAAMILSGARFELIGVSALYLLYVSLALRRSHAEYLQRLDLEDELRQQRDLCQQQSRRDGLTGLATRRRFSSALEEWSAQARTQGAPLSLLILDLDHFKAINDQHGHARGDACLRAFADRLQAALPKDRFVIVPLSIDGPTKPKVVPFYKEQKLTQLGIYFDKGRKAMQGLDVTLLPTSILVDPAGRELGRIEGDADWDMPESIELMKAAIAA